MRKFTACLFIVFLALGGLAQALPRYYIFGAAEDDCVIKKTKVEGEACLCIEVHAQAQEPLWKLDWKAPRCDLEHANQTVLQSMDCANGGCTQRECLVELYDTQHDDNFTVSQKTCIENQLPMLSS